MSKQLVILTEFRKYELELYKYLFGDPNKKEDIDFYFISKEYILNFCNKFNFSAFSDEIDNLLTYIDSPDTKENKIIKEGLVENLNERINQNLKMEKINNQKMIQKFISKEMFYLKFNQEGSFIPLTHDIWEMFSDYYDHDIILNKKGFLSEGEIFIISEEEKKIDCFFTIFNTKDIIYHFCFIVDNFNEFAKVINFFKMVGPKFSARFLLLISHINISGVNIRDKFRIKVPNNVIEIGNYDLTVYLIDKFKFNDYEGKNFDSIQEKNKPLFQIYQMQNSNIINSINK